MTNKPLSYAQTWNLDSLFSGGSHSSSLQALLLRTKQRIQRLQKKFKQISDLKQGLLQFQELEGYCYDLESFISCLLAQDVRDQQAVQLHSQAIQLRTSCDSLGAELDTLLASLDTVTFRRLLADPDIQPLAFNLQERRQRIQDKLPLEQEQLIRQLSMDGYQGWHELYSTFMGQLRIPSPFPEEESLSVGQAENRLYDPNRQIRQAWFTRWEETWKANEDLVAQMLNHLGGFRLNLYAARGWTSVLKEPLFYNRTQQQTLDTMWQTVEEYKDVLKEYLACKAHLLGLKHLAWYDVEAPLPNALNANYSFDEAAQLIIRTFSDFSPSMGSFAQQAFEQRWIEAEDRPNKMPGGFCTPLLRAKESRIFMTYSDTIMNLFTLAHELGHAYHSYEVRKLPILAQQYAMNVAETASTLAEMVVIDSLIQQSTDPHAQLVLLDYKLQRSVLFLMNIQTRFIFELNFYQQRRRGFVPAHELSALMEQAQKQAFGDALSQWNPHFWVSKQHFYLTEVPFYNFPYTFGYLFSLGTYAHLQQVDNREKAYAALLYDTGRKTTEDLAEQHLGVKLGEPFFWKGALDLIKHDISIYKKISLHK